MLERAKTDVVAPTTGALLSIGGLGKSYPVRGHHDRLELFTDISLTVQPGQLLSIIGPSGCGKTTLLRLMAGLLESEAGEVRFRGELVTRPSPHMSMVFQDIRLLPWRTVQKNVELALELLHHRRCSPDEQREVREYLSAVGLEPFARAYPHQLSGGMQQRGGFARALVRKPDLVLLDEPFGALDAQTRLVMQDLLLSLMRRFEFTAVLVTHDIDEAVYLSSHVAVFSQGPRAQIKELVTVDLPWPERTPASREDPRFLLARTHLWELLRGESAAVWLAPEN